MMDFAKQTVLAICLSEENQLLVQCGLCMYFSWL